MSGAGRTSSAVAGFTPEIARVPCGGRRTATSAAGNEETVAARAVLMGNPSGKKRREKESKATVLPQATGLFGRPTTSGAGQNISAYFRFLFALEMGFCTRPDGLSRHEKLLFFAHF
jgi:hypothetical protein